MFDFDPKSRIARDLVELKQKHGFDFIELDVRSAFVTCVVICY